MSLPAECTGTLTDATEPLVSVTESTIGIASASKQTAPKALKSPPSARRRLIIGALLIAVGVLGFLVHNFGLSNNAVLKIAGIVALISSGCLAFEVVELLRGEEARTSPLKFMPVSGALLICGAAIIAAFDPRGIPALVPDALIGGPALTVGALLVLRALVARIWDQVDAEVSLIPGFPRDAKVVAEGEVFPLTPGIIVPTDGRIISGSCSVLERYLSPEAHFRVKDEADVVFAGSYVLGGDAQVQALTGSYDSCLKRLELAVLPGLRWVEESLKRDSERIVLPFAYVLLFCAVSSAIFWDERAATGSTILLASGTILTISLLGQLGEALYALRSRLVRLWAQRGFLINSAKAWTELHHVHEIAFDPSRLDASTACHVKELNLLDDRISEESLCGCIAAIVGRAEDRALATIGDYCQRVVGSISVGRVVDLREYPGRGIAGLVRGIEFSIGSEDFLVDRGILIQPSEIQLEEGSDDQVVLVAIGDDLIARIWVSFGQAELVTAEATAHWPKHLTGRTLDASERELGAKGLLVRGEDSNDIGREHSPEVAIFQADTLQVPSSSIVALTPQVGPLAYLVRDCRRHVDQVMRARAWILFAAFTSICLVFAGVVSPLIPVALLPVIALCIFF